MPKYRNVGHKCNQQYNIPFRNNNRMTPSLPQNPIEIPVVAFEPCADTTEKQKCSLCHQVIVPHSPVKYLCCTHIYHSPCIDEWLHQNIHCPVCSTQCIFPIATAITEKSQLSHPSSTTPLKGNGYEFSKAYNKEPPKLFNCRNCNQPFERDASIRQETIGWYRCRNCRDTDIVSLAKSSCILS